MQRRARLITRLSALVAGRFLAARAEALRYLPGWTGD